MYHGERFNGISHLIGAIAAIAGLVVLVVLAARQGDPWKIASFSVYGSTLVMLFVFSTLYHSLRGKPKAFFRQLDHHAIYLLIAGTYTPFTLVMLREGWGLPLFGVIWGLAVVGMVVDSLPSRRRIIPIVIYLLMGWLSLTAIKPLMDALSREGFLWLLLGGIFYTVGIIFYALDKRVRHFHGIWHLFVLAGSVTHYFVVLFYVA